MKRFGDLEIDQDLDFQEKEWRIQNIAWITLIVILVLAMLGLFGTGPLSSATAGSTDDGLSVDFERFTRHDGEVTLNIEVSPDQVTDGQAEIWISTDYLAENDIERISPEPDEVRTDGERHIYAFLVEEPAAPIAITLAMSPQSYGPVTADIGIVDGPMLAFRQFVYP